MKAQCRCKTGLGLVRYPRKAIGTTEETCYGELEIGRIYLVMGMTLVDGVLNYLIDSGRVINAHHHQLFEIIENKIPPTWFFRSFTDTDKFFQGLEAIWGYHELVFDSNHYEKLIEMEDEAHETYFLRKIELEQVSTINRV